MSKTRLYLITPPSIILDAFADDLAAALDAGDVACVQLRLKEVDDTAILRAGERLMPMVQRHGAAFIVNDRPDLARQLGADGVHVGRDDMPYAQARAIVGADHIVGVTCHNSRDVAMRVGEAGADYVAFGAFFPTSTKLAKAHADIDILRWWSDLFETPCVAIGGITVANAPFLVEAGADFLAVSAGVWQHEQGPAAAVKAFNALFA